ncbi:MAG TPA: hypothetical protein VKU62_00080 [Thermoanaerobaculia bacterium]|nr:hypothetical protein [Thermoanaerobaculia bacterium]
MNATLVIARRELTEKRFVFVTALAFLALVLAVPFMPGVHDDERAGALIIGSLILATALSVGLAAILGGSIVGRELADGRLSFYFSKPLPATSIWWGKLIAAMTLILASFVIVGFPALLAGGAAALRGWTAQGTGSIFGFILSGALALFLLAHVIGTFVRSRSAWFLFDFSAAVICGTAMWMLVRALLTGFAQLLALRMVEAFAVFLALSVIAGGAWQLERGRTDRRRSHMELSRFLWVSIGCGVLIVAAFVAWVVSVRPGDLKVSGGRQSGQWAFIGGVAKNRLDYRAAFLYNVVDGRAVRLTAPPWNGVGIRPDLATWFVRSDGVYELWFARLSDAHPKPRYTGIAVKQWSSTWLSSDGLHVRVLDRQGIVSEYDLASGKLLRAYRWTRTHEARPPLPAGARYVVDIGNGRIVAAMANGSALMQGGRILRSEQGIWPSAGGVATIPLLARVGDQMVLWNPLTGERRAIR